MRWTSTLALVAALVAGEAGAADLWSRAFEFKASTPLRVDADLGSGVKLESIAFELDGGAFGQPRAQVTIINLGDAPVALGLAIAVVDGTERLVGASTGGTKMFPLRPDRKMTYTLVFDDVNGAIASAAAFRISVETRR